MAFLDWLFGGSAPTVTPAPPLSEYPTDASVEFARKNHEFDIGPSMFANNERILAAGIKEPNGRNGSFVPASPRGAALGLLDKFPSTYIAPVEGHPDGRLMNAHAKAQLASKESSLAALGYDPSRSIFDVTMNNPSVAGVYSPKNDKIMVLPAEGGKHQSALVHESIHRGRAELAKSGFNMTGMPDDEMLVRHIMRTKMGNPEMGRGDAGDRQIKQSQVDFEIGPAAGLLQERYAAMEAAANKLLMERQRKMGPR